MLGSLSARAPCSIARLARSRPEALDAALIAIVVGLAAGILAQRADYATAWLSTLASFSGPWLALAIVLAARAPTARAGAINATLFFTCFVSTYYVAYAASTGAAPTPLTEAWLLVAVVLGPLVGMCSVRAGSPTWLGPTCSAILAALFLGEAVFVATSQSDAFRWPTVAIDVACALAVVTLMPPRRTLRLRALVYLPVAGGLAAAAFSVGQEAFRALVG